MRAQLYQIQEQTGERAESILRASPDWPCRKGCSDCCEHLASEPRVSEVEWQAMAEAIRKMPPTMAAEVRRRIAAAAGQARPIVCALLDRESGACLIYEARPVACRAYGFYAERSEVLGCHRIEARADANIVWGNHSALLRESDRLGPAVELSKWLERDY